MTTVAEAREDARRVDGRFGQQEHSAPEVEVVDEAWAWLPEGLPLALRGLACGADLLRRFCDAMLPLNGAGACLPASAIVGMRAREAGIEVRLVCGTFRDESHWWMESGEFIFDPTAGQFGDDLPSVLSWESDDYEALDVFPCGHDSIDMLYAEARRAFAYPPDAEAFVDAALEEVDDGYRLAARN
jgi:hypothetical protein